jgi:anthranilate phosphoribosyltransferase
MNAGAALYVAAISNTIEEGVAAAADAIDDGSALDALERLRAATQSED